MKQAIETGADIVNDVRALKRDGAADMVAELGVPVILMHMRGEPSTMNDLVVYDDVMFEVQNELTQSINKTLSAGVKPANIIIDAGFGFAKDYQHHKTMLNEFYQFHQLGFPIMFGISRKRFLGEVLTRSDIASFNNPNTKHDVKERDLVGMAAALIVIQQGASIIRTHNVAMTMQAVSLWKQLQSSTE